MACCGGAAGDGGMRVLVAAVECQKFERSQFEINGEAFALDLAEILAHEQDGGGGWIDGYG